MDWLDRISIWAIVILVIASSALISHHMGEARQKQALQQPAEAVSAVSDEEFKAKAGIVRTLLESGSIEKAEALAAELVAQRPYNAEAHFLRGDILFRKHDPVAAAFAFRDAVDLNPDYLDKKTPLFQGKKLKNVVAEALAEIDRHLEQNPGDTTARENRKLMHYLQRRIAGSCG